MTTERGTQTPEDRWIALVRDIVDSGDFQAPQPECNATIPWKRWEQIDALARGIARELAESSADKDALIDKLSETLERAERAEAVANGLRSQEPCAFILTTKIPGQIVERATLPGYCLAPDETLIRQVPLYAALATDSVAAPQEAKPLAFGEEAATSEQPAAATEPQETDSEGWSKHPEHWANKSQANGLRSQEPVAYLNEWKANDQHSTSQRRLDFEPYIPGWVDSYSRQFATSTPLYAATAKPVTAQEPVVASDEALRIEGLQIAVGVCKSARSCSSILCEEHAWQCAIKEVEATLRAEIKRRQASAGTGLAPGKDEHDR